MACTSSHAALPIRLKRAVRTNVSKWTPLCARVCTSCILVHPRLDIHWLYKQVSSIDLGANTNPCNVLGHVLSSCSCAFILVNKGVSKSRTPSPFGDNNDDDDHSLSASASGSFFFSQKYKVARGQQPTQGVAYALLDHALHGLSCYC